MVITNLSGLLEKPQSARLNGQQCLKHPWLAQDTLHLKLSDRTLHKLETLKMRRLDMHTLPEHRLGYTFYSSGSWPGTGGRRLSRQSG